MDKAREWISAQQEVAYLKLGDKLDIASEATAIFRRIYRLPTEIP
jgi:hypothetical protein